MFAHVKCISGSTILGSGDVALILDVPALVRQAIQSQPQAHDHVQHLHLPPTRTPAPSQAAAQPA
jgi:chemotaxis protein histidine kinase CheA